MSIRPAARGLEAVVNAVAVCCAGGVAVLSFFYAILAYPQADDLERTAAMRMFTPLERLHSDYLRVDGRWASLFVQYLCYHGQHIVGRYPAILLALLAIGLLGCCCAVAVLGERRLDDPRVLAGGLVAYALLWLTAPRGEAFYWFPAAMGYWLPLALGMFLLCVLQRGTGWGAKVVVVVMAILVPAFHEICGGWVVGVLGVMALIGVAKPGPRSRTALVACLAGLAAIASVVLAPGVRMRMADAAHQSPLAALREAVYIERVLFAHWGVLLPVLLAILLAAARLPRRPDWYAAAPGLIRACLVAAIVPLPVVLLAAISYSLGGAMPARLYDGIYFLLAGALATAAVACGSELQRVAAIRALLGGPWGALLRAAITVVALAQATHLPRFRDATGEIEPAIRNRALVATRTDEILAARAAGARDVVVSQRLTPLWILPTDLGLQADPDWYVNREMATYFGLRSLRLAPAPPAKTGG